MCKLCYKFPDEVPASSQLRKNSGSVLPPVIRMTEMMTAVKAGDLNVVRTMFTALRSDEVAHVVRYQTPETRESLLFGACVTGRLETVRFLLAMGRGQSGLYTAWGAGPLHASAERCHEDIVRLLLKNGADMNAQTSYGDTPLHLAAHRGHYPVVRCLVEAGCDLNIHNSKGITALDDAKMARHSRVVQYLTAVMRPDSEERKDSEVRDAPTNKTDLMETRPLVPPVKTHQRLDRSISWHSCPDDIIHSNTRATKKGRMPSQTDEEFSVISEDKSLNDLSMASESERCGEHGCKQRQLHTSSGRSCADKRRDFRNRSASDSRVEYLERMVKYLRVGLTTTQEELGRTRQELRQARDLLRSPTRQMMEVQSSGNPTRLTAQLRERNNINPGTFKL